jgi:hypothetical protein
MGIHPRQSGGFALSLGGKVAIELTLQSCNAAYAKT